MFTYALISWFCIISVWLQSLNSLSYVNYSLSCARISFFLHVFLLYSFEKHVKYLSESFIENYRFLNFAFFPCVYCSNINFALSVFNLDVSFFLDLDFRSLWIVLSVSLPFRLDSFHFIALNINQNIYFNESNYNQSIYFFLKNF